MILVGGTPRPVDRWSSLTLTRRLCPERPSHKMEVTSISVLSWFHVNDGGKLTYKCSWLAYLFIKVQGK